MSDPFFDHRLDSQAFPPALRAASAVLTVAIVGASLAQAWFAAANVVA